MKTFFAASRDGGRTLPWRPAALALVLVLVAIGLFAPAFAEPDQPQTSYAYTPSGHRAFLELLLRTGVPASRWHSIPQRLTGTGRALFLLESDPELVAHRESYLDALLAWARAGNALVIAPRDVSVIVSEVRGRPVEMVEPEKDLGLDQLLVRELHLRIDRTEAPDLAPGAPVETALPDVRSLALASPRIWSDVPAEATTVVASGGRPLVVDLACGAGHLVLVAVPEIFANGRIELADHAMLALQLAAAYGPRGVLLDELFHGLTGPAGLLELCWRGPMRAVTLTLGLALALWIWSRAVRFGRAREPLREPRRSKEEHIQAMGEVLRRGRKPGMLPARLRRGLLEDLAERLHARSDARAERVLELARGAAPGTAAALDQVAAELSAIDEQASLAPGEVVALARRVHTVRKEIAHGRGR